MTKAAPSLGELRREIDRIDDAMHDLIMRRAEAVGRMRGIKGDGLRLRPAREAEILRRLAGRHRGAFPRRALFQIWREILGAMVGLQQSFAVAVPAPAAGLDFALTARNEYGIGTRLHRLDSAGQVVAAVCDGSVGLGLVPLPASDEGAPWWPGLAAPAAAGLNIVGRVPFDGGPAALVLACLEAAASGEDRSFLVLESGPGRGRAALDRALAPAGLELTAAFACRRRADGGWLHLVEIDGFVGPDDARLGQLATAGGDSPRLVRHAGGYAVPLTGAAADEKEPS